MNVAEFKKWLDQFPDDTEVKVLSSLGQSGGYLSGDEWRMNSGISEVTEDGDFELRDARLQDHENRQNSIETDDTQLRAAWLLKQAKVINLVKESYNWAIENGIAKEQARAILPEGLTLSRMYMNGTLRSWVHYIELRSENGTQKEHMQIAHEVAKVISKIFPLNPAATLDI